MKKQFQFPYNIVPEDQLAWEVDGLPKSFQSVPLLKLSGQDGKTIYEVTKAEAKVKMKMRGADGYVVAINDIRQTDKEGWVAFLNGSIPRNAANRCFTRKNDMLVWVFMPVKP